jgi:hypothetical protein
MIDSSDEESILVCALGCLSVVKNVPALNGSLGEVALPFQILEKLKEFLPTQLGTFRVFRVFCGEQSPNVWKTVCIAGHWL